MTPFIIHIRYDTRLDTNLGSPLAGWTSVTSVALARWAEPLLSGNNDDRRGVWGKTPKATNNNS